MNEIPLRTCCKACSGKGCLSTGKTFVLAGREHPLLSKCIACDGKGTQLTWVDVRQLNMLLHTIAAEKGAE